jgi:hypothetical protein
VAKCIFCDNDLTGETKPEHIVLNAQPRSRAPCAYSARLTAWQPAAAAFQSFAVLLFEPDTVAVRLRKMLIAPRATISSAAPSTPKSERKSKFSEICSSSTRARPRHERGKS